MLLNRYELVEEVGRGGMGVVWRAVDRLIGQRRALKFLPEALSRSQEAVDLVCDEARVLMSLTHEGIVRVFTIERAGNWAFLVMEFLEGPTLHELLRERRRTNRRGLDADETMWIAHQMAAPLEYAHAKGVTHLDIKPSNLMFTQAVGDRLLDCEVPLKLTDFGIAFVATSTLSRMTGYAPSGTLPFMAPEILDGRLPTPAADVYSCAATLFNLVTGQPPFTHGDILQQIRRQEPEPAASGDADLDAAIAAGLQKDPTRRPPSVAALVETADGRGSSTTILLGQSERAGRSPRKLWVGLLAGAAVAAVAVTVALRNRPEDLNAVEGAAGRRGGSEPDNGASAEATPGSRAQLEPSRNAGSASSSPVAEVEAPSPVFPASVNEPPLRVVSTKPGTEEPITAGFSMALVITFDRPVARVLLADEELTLSADGLSASGSLHASAAEHCRVEWSATDENGAAWRGAVTWPVRSAWGNAPESLAGAFTVAAPRWISDAGREMPAGLVHRRTGIELLYVPGGSFRLGSPSRDPDRGFDEGPEREVALSGFYVARTEMTASAWARGGGEPEVGRGGELPVVDVTWTQATAWCRNNNLLLPTEAQWEYAASGPRDLPYPWGSVWEPSRCSSRGTIQLEPVGSHPDGASWCGALDMAGSVAEWCRNAYSQSWAEVRHGSVDPLRDERHRHGAMRVARGGSFVDGQRGCRTSNRNDAAPDRGYGFIGFRPVLEP